MAKNERANKTGRSSVAASGLKRNKQSAKDAKSIAASALTQKPSKGETWRVSDDGNVRTVRTSNSSVRVMDKAVSKYAKALKRLADK